MIKIIAVGKLKEDYLKNGVEDYLKRISKYSKIEIVEVSDINNSDVIKSMKSEGDAILKHIKDRDYVISMAIDGEEFSSQALASELDKINMSYSNICFIIGGSNGLCSEVLDRSNLKLSFSKLTFPHGLFRLILLEQIYRTYKIRNNEKYHK